MSYISMGRRAGPSNKKILEIKQCLKKHSNGIWIREIARQTGISKSTVHRYISQFMKDDVKEVISISKLVKIFKLKEKWKRG